MLPCEVEVMWARVVTSVVQYLGVAVKYSKARRRGLEVVARLESRM